MKKLVVAIVVALVVIVGAGPWYMGRVAHSRVDKGLDSLVEKVPYIRIAERKWSAGWFRSESLVTFEFVLPGLGGTPVAALADAAPVLAQQRFSVRSDVLHGPVLGGAGLGLARLDTKFVINEQIRSKLIEVLGTEEPVKIRTRMGFFGGGTTTLSGDARTIALSKLGAPRASGTIAWDDFSLAIGMSRGGKSYDVSGRQPRIEFTSDDGKEHALFSNLSVEGKGSRVTEDLYDGKVGFGVGKVSVASSRSPAVDVSDIRYDIDSTSKGDYFDYAFRMGSGEVKTAALDSLKFQLKEVHYDMTLRHLHTPTLQKLTRALRDSYSNAMGNPLGAEAALMAPLAEHGRELLKHDPEFVIDRIGVVTAEGEAAFRGVIKLQGVTDEDLASGAMALLPKLVADITFEAPQALFENVPNGNMIMGMGLDQGYVKREGGKVTSHIEFRDGKLSINGKSPQLPPMFGGQPPAPPEPLPEAQMPAPPEG
ncbi:MAG: YdgA family protein [Proteobacteria bacterium]|jgi:uncharacterized protein YdgA (DUF945 family)|nr:YdgA family protein [Pseudomonadota bacterium]MBK9252704.1 YdgA family protein [Pseudomonadota bacterium]